MSGSSASPPLPAAPASRAATAAARVPPGWPRPRRISPRSPRRRDSVRVPCPFQGAIPGVAQKASPDLCRAQSLPFGPPFSAVGRTLLRPAPPETARLVRTPPPPTLSTPGRPGPGLPRPAARATRQRGGEGERRSGRAWRGLTRRKSAPLSHFPSLSLGVPRLGGVWPKVATRGRRGRRAGEEEREGGERGKMAERGWGAQTERERETEWQNRGDGGWNREKEKVV